MLSLLGWQNVFQSSEAQRGKSEILVQESLSTGCGLAATNASSERAQREQTSAKALAQSFASSNVMLRFSAAGRCAWNGLCRLGLCHELLEPALDRCISDVLVAQDSVCIDCERVRNRIDAE